MAAVTNGQPRSPRGGAGGADTAPPDPWAPGGKVRLSMSTEEKP